MATISTARLLELEAAERRLKERDDNPMVVWVGKELGTAYAINLASKPYSQWTEREKGVLRAVCGSATNARAAYIAALPRE